MRRLNAVLEEYQKKYLPVKEPVIKVIIGSFRLDYEYEIEYEYEF